MKQACDSRNTIEQLILRDVFRIWSGNMSLRCEEPVKKYASLGATWINKRNVIASHNHRFMIPENANKIPEDYNTNELLNFLLSPDYQFYNENYNYNSKDLEGKDQRQDERNVIL